MQLDERIKREGIKTHKERVEELNRYLSNLSEHHDMFVFSFPSRTSPIVCRLYQIKSWRMSSWEVEINHREGDRRKLQGRDSGDKEMNYWLLTWSVM